MLALIYKFQIIKEVYHIFTLLKAIYVLPVKCLFMIFAHFSIIVQIVIFQITEAYLCKQHILSP